MATTWYTNTLFKEKLIKGAANLTQPYKCILLTKNNLADPRTISVSAWKEYSRYQSGYQYDVNYIQQFELTATGTGYTQGGIGLNQTITDISGTYPLWKFDSSDITWTNLNTSNTEIGICGIAIYNTTATGAGGANLVMAVGIFDAPAKFTTSNYTVQFSADGIIQI